MRPSSANWWLRIPAAGVACDRVKIVVQQVSTRLFLKRYAVWIRLKEDAKVFGDALVAIKYCLSYELRDVRLARFTDSWELQGYLDPFLTTGLDLSSNVMVAELRKSIETNRALREKQDELKMHLDGIAAELKERKKARLFERQPISDDAPKNADEP